MKYNGLSADSDLERHWPPDRRIGQEVADDVADLAALWSRARDTRDSVDHVLVPVVLGEAPFRLAHFKLHAAPRGGFHLNEPFGRRLGGASRPR